jgi:hypothetical protein
MARRGDAARILEARREGVRQRLMGIGMLPHRVDELLAAFVVAPGSQGLPRAGRYWEAVRLDRRSAAVVGAVWHCRRQEPRPRVAGFRLRGLAGLAATPQVSDRPRPVAGT